MRDSISVALVAGVAVFFVLFLGGLLLTAAPLLATVAFLGGVATGLLIFAIDRRTDQGE